MKPYGYISIDDRVSGGTLQEFDYFTCPHCNRCVTMNPDRIRPRHFCARCGKNTCDLQICVETCIPYVPILMWGTEKDQAQLTLVI